MLDAKTEIKELKWEFLFSGRRLSRAIRLALKSLWLHRLRSLLTMLGIVFGVCSVIAMLAIGEGASSEAQEQIKNLGSLNIILRSAKPPDEQKVSNNGGSIVLEYGLTQLDLRRIESTIPGVSSVIPSRLVREYVWNATRRVDCEIVGTLPAYTAIRNQAVGMGRFFTDRESETGANVCVLTAGMAKMLFPTEAAIGKDVRVSSDYYRVIGVMEGGAQLAGAANPQGSSSVPVQRMYIPLSSAKLQFGEVIFKRRAGSFEAERVALHEITVKVDERDAVANVSLAIKDLLGRNHKKKDYEMVVPLELLKQAERTKQIFNIVLGSIAAISLLVGGIGIMNIMLANVTERTREIGIRRALGARRRDIVTQFLVEAVMLSGTGGVVGVVLGITLPLLVTYFAGMKTVVTFWSPVIAFSISAIIGIVFGLYPAQRAAKMDPVEALRHN